MILLNVFEKKIKFNVTTELTLDETESLKELNRKVGSSSEKSHRSSAIVDDGAEVRLNFAKNERTKLPAKHSLNARRRKGVT